MTPQDVALFYHKLGANVTAIGAHGKGPAHTWDRWQQHRQEAIDVRALPWRGYTVKRDSKRYKAGQRVEIGGVGIISGINGWRVFDLDPQKEGETRRPVSDATVDTLIKALGLPADYRWVYRSGSGAGWEIIIRCEERLPDGALTPDKREKGVYTGWPADGADWHHLELRWESCQTVAPPSFDGRGYAWRLEPPTQAPALVPVRRIIAAFYSLVEVQPYNLGTVERAIVDAIKERFDLVAYAQQQLGGEAVNEGHEIRVLGHQGLLIDPERGIWYIHGEQIGGDAIDLVAFCKYQTTARNLNGKSAEILQDAALFAGVVIPEKTPPAYVDPSTGEVIGDIPPSPTPDYVMDWRRQGATAAELYHTEFAPLIWTVENILPEGGAVIAGKPKSRKSWAALAAAVAAALGIPMFGRLQVRQGRVLYLDLESNQRRMRGRLFSMIGHRMEKLDNLHVYTEWPRGEDGLRALEEWMQAYPDTVLIVIDVLADFRRPRDPKEDAYAYDRETVKPINAFAEHHRITVLLIHHTRKAKADDVFDEISGSTGLPSAVATMWVLGRAPNGSGEMVLAMRGRDLINDDPLMLEWDDYDNQFKIVGGAADALQSGERRAVLQVMADDAEWGPKEIAAELRKPVANVQQLLKGLLSDGLIAKTGRGKYVRVLSRDQNDQNHQKHKKSQNDQIRDSDLRRHDQNQDQNRLSRPNRLNSPSDHSDRSYTDDSKRDSSHHNEADDDDQSTF